MKVIKDTFSVEEKRLDITIDFEPGSTFTCPDYIQDSRSVFPMDMHALTLAYAACYNVGMNKRA